MGGVAYILLIEDFVVIVNSLFKIGEFYIVIITNVFPYKLIASHQAILQNSTVGIYEVA